MPTICKSWCGKISLFVLSFFFQQVFFESTFSFQETICAQVWQCRCMKMQYLVENLTVGLVFTSLLFLQLVYQQIFSSENIRKYFFMDNIIKACLLTNIKIAFNFIQSTAFAFKLDIHYIYGNTDNTFGKPMCLSKESIL